MRFYVQPLIGNKVVAKIQNYAYMLTKAGYGHLPPFFVFFFFYFFVCRTALCLAVIRTYPGITNEGSYTFVLSQQ